MTEAMDVKKKKKGISYMTVHELSIQMTLSYFPQSTVDIKNHCSSSLQLACTFLSVTSFNSTREKSYSNPFPLEEPEAH